MKSFRVYDFFLIFWVYVFNLTLLYFRSRHSPGIGNVVDRTERLEVPDVSRGTRDSNRCDGGVTRSLYYLSEGGVPETGVNPQRRGSIGCE